MLTCKVLHPRGTPVGSQQHPRRSTTRPLLAESLERRDLLTGITSVEPPAGSHSASISTPIRATFNQDIDGATASSQTFVLHSSRDGQLTAAESAITSAGVVVTLNPIPHFRPGELIQVSATSGMQSTAESPVVPHVWQFRTAPTAGSGLFSDSGQSLGNHNSRAVAIGDLDGDGDLDAVVHNRSQNNRVWLNDGGLFSDSGHQFGANSTRGSLSLGDLDGDGDVDAFVTNGQEGNRVWLNHGGLFSDSGQVVGNRNSRAALLGDLDGDGDLDAFVLNLNQGNRVWLNDGGLFTDSGQILGDHASLGGSLGDLDGDGDLDAVVANFFEQTDEVWLNNGGLFSDSGQILGNHASRGIELGDLDGDGDLDAVVVTESGNPIKLNDGSGVLSDSGQTLGNYNSRSVALGDLDHDGDLDAFIANYYQGHRVWRNEGGLFADTGQVLGRASGWDVELGDLDGDGDLDAFVANVDEPNRVWFDAHEPALPEVILVVDNESIVEASGVATFMAELSTTSIHTVTVDLEFAGTATLTTDYIVSGARIVIPPGNTSGSVTVTSVQDRVNEPNETVVVGVANVTNGLEKGNQQAATEIVDDDAPPEPKVTLSVDNGEVVEAGGVATFTVALSDVTTVSVIVEISIGGTATANDYAISGTQVIVEPGTTTGSVTVTAIDDEEDELDESVVIDVASVIGGSEDGQQQQTTIIVDDDPATLRITSLVPTSTGFRAEFSDELEISELNLHDSQSSEPSSADLVLTGVATGKVMGSLLFDASTRTGTFIKTGDPLLADSYTVTFRSGSDAFKGTSGDLLDGNSDGIAGDDFTATFVIPEADANAITLSLPDIVRGPGQPANIPADTTMGIPLSLSDGTGVRGGVIEIAYDPVLLTIAGATVGPAMPDGTTVTFDSAAAGIVVLAFNGSSDLPTGSNILLALHATVPATNAGETQGSQHLLDIRSAVLTTSLGVAFNVIDDDALHLVSYFADVSGNGRINASDAAQVARVAALIDDGFAATPLADPAMVGDISGNGRINAADASLVARFAALIPVPQIPPLPAAAAASGVVLVMPAADTSLDGDHQGTRSMAKVLAEASVDEMWGDTAFWHPAKISQTAGEWSGKESHNSGSLEQAFDELFNALAELDIKSL